MLTTVLPVEMVVDRPPRTASDASRLAAEQMAFAPEDEDSSVYPDALSSLADRLRSSGTVGFRSKRYWVFSHPD